VKPESSLDEQMNVEKFDVQGVNVWVLRELRPDTKRATFVAAEVEVNATVSEVWESVRSYEKYSDVFQNVFHCSATRRSDQNKLFLALNLSMQCVYWKLEASTNVAVEEQEESVLGRKQITFSQFDGDFESFQGRWLVEPTEDAANPHKSLLRLEIEVATKATLPAAMTRHVIRQIPNNLKSLAKFSENISMRNLRTNVPFIDEAMMDARVQVPEASPFDDMKRMWDTQKESVKISSSSSPYQYLGVAEIPLPPTSEFQPKDDSSSSSASSRGEMASAGVSSSATSATSAQEEDKASSPSYPEIKLGENANEVVSKVEIHFRKLDNDDFVHNRIVASVEIDASKEAVWATLTDYDKLPTILPNLVLSQRIVSSKSLPGRLRLRQVVFKELMYLCFRAEALLDVLEKPQNEIQFQLRNGTFDKLQGKFLLQKCYDEDHNEIEDKTNLVYAVEIRIPRGIQTFAIAPLVEKFAFEDVSNNMAVLREHIEREFSIPPEEKVEFERPGLSLMKSDFEVYKAEFIRTFGGDGNTTMPLRGDLRAAGRFDLERASYAHGGLEAVAERIGWKKKYQRKPKNYWEEFNTLVSEIEAFIEEHNLDPTEFPKGKSLIENSRRDIVNAIVKHGGTDEVAERMGLTKVPRIYAGSRKPQSAWQEFKAKVGEETGLEGEELSTEAKRRYRKDEV
jgi:ribosome-associated toxin RatA of RatAB toxin-antitoxin module